jgi:nicotinamidase-related amidase/type 1 glutamine amidotransferase
MSRRPASRAWIVALCLGGLATGFVAVQGTIPAAQAADAASDDAPALRLTTRARVVAADAPTSFAISEQAIEWNPHQTALIICDMWDDHWCRGASARVAEIAPRMNELVRHARQRGVLIVHSPSGCMAPYQDHPARLRAHSAPPADNLPPEIGSWCRHIPAEEQGEYPIDQDDGGCDCQPSCPHGSPWRRQIEAIEIADEDAISDSGEEIWNLLEARGIDNVMVMGVHTNMCVLGRPFGLRNLSRYGKNTVLVRDMTDTMYNSRSWPYVHHFQGTDLIIEHIEKFVCPTISSEQLVGGQPFRFQEDRRPKIVIVISEPEYRTNETLPVFARDVLRDDFGFDTLIIEGDSKQHTIAGLAEALPTANLLLLSMRRQALPPAELQAVRDYLAAGKPLVGIRTSSHPFDARGQGPAGHAEWPGFDPEVLGGNYTGHHGAGPTSTLVAAEGAAEHPILTGIDFPFTSPASLYKTSPLASSTTALLVGSIPDAPAEPTAWTNTFGDCHVFYTSLGHVDDFADPNFVRLLGNAVHWALDRPVPLVRPVKTAAR